MSRTVRLVLALGVDAGRFYHDFGRGSFGDTDIDARLLVDRFVNRNELRLEGAIGCHFLPDWPGETRHAFLVAVEPYGVAHAERPPVEPCSSCEKTDYRQDFGVVLVFNVSWWFPL